MGVKTSRLLSAVLLASCGLTQFGPWLDESGQRLEGSQLVEYQGFEECGHEDVVFLVFFGDMYAKDAKGTLGELLGASGDVLSYVVLDEVPDGANPSGFTSGQREIYFDDASREDYLYIHREDGRAERWPRAESPCDLPGSGS